MSSSSSSQTGTGSGEEETTATPATPITNGDTPAPAPAVSPKPKTEPVTPETDDILSKAIPIPILNTTTILPSVEKMETVSIKIEDSETPPQTNGEDSRGNGEENRGEENRGHPERKRKLSSDSLDSSATKLSGENDKDDDDDNDDDDDEKLVQDADPERLKAFNMFVRLFVDENLDRMIPISKQPKDKVQAILEACDRQFPEFHDRSRKRIRTYLKSCRRLKRSKDSNGYETLRPTPPHLTSAAAEGILAQACENESQNAKRMRIGLEPLPAAVMNPHPPTHHHLLPGNNNNNGAPGINNHHHHHNGILSSALNGPVATAAHKPSLGKPAPSSILDKNTSSSSSLATDYLRHLTPPPSSFRSPHADLTSTTSFFANGNGSTGLGVGGLFRPAGFPTVAGYTPPAHQHPSSSSSSSSLSHAATLASSLQNGPTDLSVKGGKTPSTATSGKSQLNPNEMSTIKQLIAGYRESAAFLYASADELEQLLLQQN